MSGLKQSERQCGSAQGEPGPRGCWHSPGHVRPSSGRKDGEAGSSSVRRKRSSRIQGATSVTSVHPAWSAETRAGLGHRPGKEGPPLQSGPGTLSSDGGCLTWRLPAAQCQDSRSQMPACGQSRWGGYFFPLGVPAGGSPRAGTVRVSDVMPRPPTRPWDSCLAGGGLPVWGASLMVGGCPL